MLQHFKPEAGPITSFTSVTLYYLYVPAKIEQDNVSMKVLCIDVKMVKVKPVENEKIQFNIAYQMCPSACNTCLVSPSTFCDDVPHR